MVPGSAGLATPAGAEKLTVRLSDVSVSGGLPQLAEAPAALKARLSRRQVTGAEIFAAARELEATYAQAGFVLVRVILPPQHLVNGSKLRLTVIDGFIERIETKNLPERVRARIEQLVGPLTGSTASCCASWSDGNGVSYAGFVNGENSLVLSGALTYGGSSQGAKNAAAMRSRRLASTVITSTAVFDRFGPASLPGNAHPVSSRPTTIAQLGAGVLYADPRFAMPFVCFGGGHGIAQSCFAAYQHP